MMVDWYGAAAYMRPVFVQGWGEELFTPGNMTSADVGAWRYVIEY
jgi:hypothetical protein